MAESEKLIEAAQFEPKDIGEGFIWGSVAVCLGLLLSCALLVLWLYPRSTLDRMISVPLPVYPEPRLQPNARAQMRNFYAQEMQQLNGTGWVDQASGIVHIPIGTAMQKIAEEGVPDWPAP
jgi:hypothetical protein